MEYYGLVLIKFIIGFIIVITHLNLSGKTQLSQMTPVDFIGNFVFGGVIGGVIYSESIPLHQYISVMLIGVILISFLNAITKHINFFRIMTIGQPIPIIKKRRFMVDAIINKRNKIDILTVSSQLHTKGIYSFQDVIYAQIEPDGQITTVCEGNEIPSVIIVKDGKPRDYGLKAIEKDTRWLENEMQKLSITWEDIFIAEFWNEITMFILKDRTVKKSI